MGAVNIAQLSTRRKQIDKEIADILEKKTNEWGITVVSVETSPFPMICKNHYRLRRALNANTTRASFWPKLRKKYLKCL